MLPVDHKTMEAAPGTVVKFHDGLKSPSIEGVPGQR